MQKVISKEDLRGLLNSLLKNTEIIAPLELPGRGIFYQPIINAEDLYLGDSFTIEPLKKFFLEPAHWLFEQGFNADGIFLKDASLSKKKRIIIGARPCETRGLVLLDKIFDAQYQDESYINNRQGTLIFGISCAKPDKSCFCTSMGGSPTQSLGMDALLFNAEFGLVVEAITDKGKEIFASLGRDLNEQEVRLYNADKDKRKDLVEKKIKTPESLEKTFADNYWSKVSLSCLSCGVCTYLCPTCHCFDLADEQRRRLRCYDGCAFRDFTQESSGENPRPTKRERYRQRVFHKFAYFKNNFGENLCVGCGRCIRFCPVKIDIAEIVDKAPI